MTAKTFTNSQCKDFIFSSNIHFTEYIEGEPHLYLMQLKQNRTVVQFLLLGRKSTKDAQTMIGSLEAADKNLAITVCFIRKTCRG